MLLPLAWLDLTGFLFPALLIVGVLLLIHGVWPGFFVGLKMRIKGIDFEAEIVGKKELYVGEAVRFKARFRGKLENGAFTVKVFGPADSILPDTGQNYAFFACPDTVIRTPKDVGRLKGARLHEYRWSGPIPTKYPTGKYRAYIRVYDDLGGRNEVIREKEDSFTVMKQDEWPFMDSGGTSSTLIGKWPPRQH